MVVVVQVAGRAMLVKYVVIRRNSMTDATNWAVMGVLCTVAAIGSVSSLVLSTSKPDPAIQICIDKGGIPIKSIVSDNLSECIFKE